MRTIRNAVCLMFCLFTLQAVGCGDLPSDQEAAADGSVAVTQEALQVRGDLVPTSSIPTATVEAKPTQKDCDDKEAACLKTCYAIPKDWDHSFDVCVLKCFNGHLTCTNSVNASPTTLSTP